MAKSKTKYEIWLSRLTKQFWKLTSPADNNGCQLWLGDKGNSGYGTLFWVDEEGAEEIWSAHRLAFFLKEERMPEPGMQVCHTCDIRLCVAWDHLWEGTAAENMADMKAKGRANYVSNPALSLQEQQTLIKTYKEKQGKISQQELGDMFGVSKRTVGRILKEAGVSKLRLYSEALDKLADAREIVQKLAPVAGSENLELLSIQEDAVHHLNKTITNVRHMMGKEVNL